MFKRPLALVGAMAVLIGCTKKETLKSETLIVGTYTDGSSEGIYTLNFNPKTGVLDALELKATLPNPSFVALSQDKKYLYAVQETADFDTLGGGVSGYSLAQNVWKPLNSKGTGGAHPCHVSLSGDGQLAVSNYSGGNVAIFDIGPDGHLGDRQLLEHNPKDTTGVAHAHKALFTKDGLFAADLGMDALMRYEKQPYGWIPATPSTLALDKGAGPRHFTFNTTGTRLYVISELNSSITVFSKEDDGSFHAMQTASTLDPNFKGDSFCADIHLSPDGAFLYGSNRGENSIVIFSVDPESGAIAAVGRESVRGDWPRNFVISPEGNHLLVANQRSNTITVFKRDQNTGLLEYTSQFEMGAPVCLVFQ